MRRAERLALLALLALGLLALSCHQAGKRSGLPPDRDTFVLQVFYTNDEHGWLEGQEPRRGAAALHAQVRIRAWANDEELWLSGGDNWTGPAISTWFEGRPVVEVMNAMGYRASAVGNHEFDFGLEALAERTAEADFRFLAANLRRRSTGEVPEDLGIRSHVVVQLGPGIGGRTLPAGIIGLITTDTPFVTNPATVAELEFLPYEPALREAAAQARAEGATALIVLAHVCVGELRELALAVEDLGVAFFGGGHCNESHAERVGGAVLLSTGGGFSELGSARLSLDPSSGRLLEASQSLWPNEASEPWSGPDQPQEIIARWHARTEEQLGTVIGRLDHELPRRSPELEQLIVTAWLEALPTAEVALMNRGGVRASLPAGDVTLADVVAVLPFQNSIVLSEVPGETLRRAIAAHHPIVGGIDPEALDPQRRYRVLSNSFCYAGGDGWTFLAESDPSGYDTSIHFRQPVIDYLTTHR